MARVLQKFKRPDWTDADAVIARQVRRLMGEAEISMDRLSALLGVSERTLRAHIREPEKMTLAEQRRLYLVCRDNGIDFDPALAEVRYTFQ